MTGRAKWDAWDAAGKKYNMTADVENRYLEIARSLGWSESIETEHKRSAKSAEVDLEHLSDEEDAPSPSTSSGLGRFVSKMSNPEVLTDKGLHDLVLSCDIPGLVSLLDNCPNVDLNALDEYVSEISQRYNASNA